MITKLRRNITKTSETIDNDDKTIKNITKTSETNENADKMILNHYEDK